VVKGGGDEKHVLVDHQLDDGGIGRGVTTTERQPLGKVMRVSSGRCITLIGGRRWDSDINISKKASPHDVFQHLCFSSK
jgi:hypothetical protein